MGAVTVAIAIDPVNRLCVSCSRRGSNRVAGGVAHGDCGRVPFLADDEHPRDAVQAVEIGSVERDCACRGTPTWREERGRGPPCPPGSGTVTANAGHCPARWLPPPE